MAVSIDSIVQEAIAPFQQKNAIPGVAIAVFDGKEGHILCYGNADLARNIAVTPDTIFDIASITKVFTTTDLALQQLRGRLNLEDSVAKYMPRLKFNSAISQVRLIDLATHTSSLPRVPPAKAGNYDRAQVVFFLQNWKPKQPIGSKYLYSNLGIGILGYVLSNIEKKPFEQVIVDDIALPLGMNSTYISIPPMDKNRYAIGYNKLGRITPEWQPGPWPAGGALKSTARDMLKFLEANLNVSGPEDLRKAMQLAQQPFFSVHGKLTMGLAWQRFQAAGPLIIDKNGGVPGFSSYIGMMPDRQIGVVVLMNKGKAHSTAIGRELLQKLHQELP